MAWGDCQVSIRALCDPTNHDSISKNCNMADDKDQHNRSSTNPSKFPASKASNSITLNNIQKGSQLTALCLFCHTKTKQYLSAKRVGFLMNVIEVVILVVLAIAGFLASEISYYETLKEATSSDETKDNS